MSKTAIPSDTAIFLNRCNDSGGEYVNSILLHETRIIQGVQLDKMMLNKVKVFPISFISRFAFDI